MFYLNEDLKGLTRIFPQDGRKGYLRLDLNENPNGLPQEIIDSALSKINSQIISQYPEEEKFTKILADHICMHPDNICLVNGSAEGIRYIIQAYTSPNGRIVGVVPSYFMYQVYSEMYGRVFVKVGYDNDLTMDVDNIISELTNDTQLLILMNPNNPMGNVYTDDEFSLILKKCKEKEITILIDEAYYYFHPKTYLKFILGNKHVFVTRTFSKFFSMAGCRLGYVIGNKEDIHYVKKMITPHNINIFAITLAKEILMHPEIIELLKKQFNGGREYLLSELNSNGYKYKGEAGNFLLININSDADEIVEKMKKERKILIKSYHDMGIFDNCIRVSIGDKKCMEKFMDALIEFDQ